MRLGIPLARTVVLAAVLATQGLSGCLGGGCPLGRTEVLSVDPAIDCLQVTGNDAATKQCVTASVRIVNNCSEALAFAIGETNFGGKLQFPPGSSGVYDASSSMQVSPNNWRLDATLGVQALIITLRTHPN
jgi:hypothetical protein